ncbi:YdcF family protein [Candidatus Bealeia paramacronuclearis]
MPLGIWMLVELENRFPQPQTLPANTVGIIVLGGSFDFMTMEGRQMPAYNLAGGRFLEFIAFTKKYPHLKRVFSGGGRDLPTIHGQKMGEADIAKMIFSDLGYDTQGMIFEGTSRTTLENATKTKEIVQPKPGEKWVLMTSAFHLPRAVGLFRKAGFDVLPYPVDYHTSGQYDPLFFLGLRDGLLSLHYATREWLSLIQNYLYGRSDEIFPGIN